MVVGVPPPFRPSFAITACYRDWYGDLNPHAASVTLVYSTTVQGLAYAS